MHFTIVYFHTESNSATQSTSVHEEAFSAFIAVLLKNGYTILSID